MIYLFSASGVSDSLGEVTEVDDINALNRLQTLVSACGQVQSRDVKDVSGRGIYWFFDGHASVGSILLDVHYGKRGIRGLDSVANRQADMEVGLT
jgi:prepilin-type processing-associated H-X9-DG protein